MSQRSKRILNLAIKNDKEDPIFSDSSLETEIVSDSDYCPSSDETSSNYDFNDIELPVCPPITFCQNDQSSSKNIQEKVVNVISDIRILPLSTCNQHTYDDLNPSEDISKNFNEGNKEVCIPSSSFTRSDQNNSKENNDYTTMKTVIYPLAGDSLNSENQSNTLCLNKRIRRRHHCFYCFQNVTNFSRHLERSHSDELQVQEILCLNKNSTKRKKLIDRLRREGDFMTTSIIPVLNPPDKNAKNHIACKFCRGYYARKCLRRHVKKCFFNPDKSKPIKSQIEGHNLMAGPFGPNDPLKISGLLNKLRADEISLVAKRDKIICEVARRYLHSHKDKHLLLVAKRHMRRLARILIEVRTYETNPKLTLEQILMPSKLKTLVKATKAIAGYDIDGSNYKSPSLALQMGTLLKKAINTALSLDIQKEQPSKEKQEDLKSLLNLIETDWSYEVSTEAGQNLSTNKFNKPTLIPLTEDIKTFDTYLQNLIKNTIAKLKANEKDEGSFKILMETIFCSLMIFNKRRVGELQRMTLQAYLKHYDNISSAEFEKALSNSEIILYKQLKRVVIKGKRGRGVPVLFEKEIVTALNYLIDLREHFNLQNNVYLFGLSGTDNPISGYNVLRKHANLALNNKERASLITSTKLRKHLATITQIFKMNKSDLEQLASFMGHTQRTHSEFYRLPDDIYQTAKVSKLLMLSKNELFGKFKGKRLDEIDLDDNIIESDQDSDTDDVNLNLSDVDEPQERNTREEQRVKEEKDKAEEKSKMLPRKKHIKTRWTEEQKKITETYFKNNISHRIPPKKHEVDQLKETYPDVFENKTWPVIKVYVCNLYNKR